MSAIGLLLFTAGGPFIGNSSAIPNHFAERYTPYTPPPPRPSGPRPMPQLLSAMIDAGVVVEPYNTAAGGPLLEHLTRGVIVPKELGMHVAYVDGKFNFTDGSGNFSTGNIETLICCIMLASSDEKQIADLFPEVTSTLPTFSEDKIARARQLAEQMMSRRNAGDFADPSKTGIPEGSTVKTEGLD